MRSDVFTTNPESGWSFEECPAESGLGAQLSDIAVPHGVRIVAFAAMAGIVAHITRHVNVTRCNLIQPFAPQLTSSYATAATLKTGFNPPARVARGNDTISPIAAPALGALQGTSEIPVTGIDGLLGGACERDDGHAFELMSAACERWVS